MLNKMIRLVQRTKRVGPAVRLYLWWGLLLRTVLLVALCTLLLIEGNFLAEWLLSWQVVPSVQPDDVEEYTTISYIVLGAFLAVGAYLRWAVIRQMNVLQEGAEELKADQE